MSGTHSNAPLPSPSAGPNHGQTPYGQQFVAPRPSASPIPLTHSNSYGSQGSASHTTIPQTPGMYQSQHNYGQYAPAPSPVSQQANPMLNYNNMYQSNASRQVPPSSSHASHGNAYNPPRPIEVYTLADTANASIPADIRAQFHHDEYGKVIFFTAPPLDVNPIPEEKQTLGHSLRFLADKARNEEEDEKKRKAKESEMQATATERVKRLKSDKEGNKNWILDQKLAALQKWTADMENGTDKLYKDLYGENWESMQEVTTARLALEQQQAYAKQKDIDEYEKGKGGRKDVNITGFRWV